jgi:hypothetical protein
MSQADHAQQVRALATRWRGRQLDADRARLALALGLLDAYDAGVLVRPLSILTELREGQVRSLLGTARQYRRREAANAQA